jgi:hypothetical protein
VSAYEVVVVKDRLEDSRINYRNNNTGTLQALAKSSRKYCYPLSLFPGMISCVLSLFWACGLSVDVVYINFAYVWMWVGVWV